MKRVTIAAAALAVAAFVAAVSVAQADDWPTPAPTVTVTVTAPVTPSTPPAPVAEDDPAWNCLTMGNHRCGPEWEPFPSPAVEGPDGTQHTGCLIRFGDTSFIVCPDGYTDES